MEYLKGVTSASLPRRDGDRVFFEITQNFEQIPCAISRGALEDISGARLFKTSDLLHCFAGARDRIEALALGKLAAQHGEVSGRLSLWADDVDELPDDAAPAKASRTAPEHKG